jgi:protein-S-isoprenylcysteine O-methyltransferase Ste14
MKAEVKENLGYIVNGVSIAAFFFLGFVLDAPLHWPIFNTIAWILLGLGVLMILASTYQLIRNRGEGLITWGIYGVVRHPMYVGAMLAFLSWAFFIPHWLTVLLAIINIAIVYWYILGGDQRNIEIFGSEYEGYMQDVPRANFLAGFLRSLRGR